MVYSEDDALSRPSDRLLDVALAAVVRARGTDLRDVCARLRGRFPYPDGTIDLWPGEHYRLLAALVDTLQPRVVVEVGTAEGLSALSMLKYLRPDARLVSFDLVPWTEYPRSCLTGDDFADGRLDQIVADIGQPEAFARHRSILGEADLVLVDAAKDGFLERRLIAHFERLTFSRRPLFAFDDIRVWNMLAIWRALRWPKLDVTSFGHWSGTGICEPPCVAAGPVTAPQAAVSDAQPPDGVERQAVEAAGG